MTAGHWDDRGAKGVVGTVSAAWRSTDNDTAAAAPIAVGKRKAPKANGVVLYEGPSVLDGAPIVVILTGLAGKASANRKTGAMLQTWILRADMAPTDAIREGADAAICGTCPHRSVVSGGGGSCYVNVGQGPRSVWAAWRRGRYGTAPVDMVTAAALVAEHGAPLRLGAYGDPAAAPIDWATLAAAAPSHTGYTHQWRHAPHLRGVCMASVDTFDEAAEARALGWATFRVAPRGDAHRERGEARCPASAEAGKRTTCAVCPIACNGRVSGAVLGRVIQAHGATAGRVKAAA